MQRFILQENSRLLRSRLATATGDDDRRRIQALLIAVEHELALYEASQGGVLGVAACARRGAHQEARAQITAEFWRNYRHSPIPAVLIDPAPGLLFVEVNDAYCQTTGFAHDDIVGRSVFSRFPENPEDPSAESTHTLYTWLRKVAETRRSGSMDFRYDIQGADGVFHQRYWRILTSPLLDPSGELVLLLQENLEVTDDVLAAKRSA